MPYIVALFLKKRRLRWDNAEVWESSGTGLPGCLERGRRSRGRMNLLERDHGAHARYLRQHTNDAGVRHACNYWTKREMRCITATNPRIQGMVLINAKPSWTASWAVERGRFSSGLASSSNRES